jgi:trehalose-6-phosphate synthase
MSSNVRVPGVLGASSVIAGIASALPKVFHTSLNRFVAPAPEPERAPIDTSLLDLGRDFRRAVRQLDLAGGAVDASLTGWSPETLRLALTSELEGSEIIVVSNREPYIHNFADQRIVMQTPASGLVAALEPVIRTCGGTWVAHGSGDADRATVDAHDRLQVPPSDPSYALRRVWLTEEEEDGYYLGFANEGLWPLCHIVFVRPQFREQDWESYRVVNERFAEVVEAEAQRPDPIVLIQDYHFSLLPRMIRERLPDATIITFWHIPWPNAETFSICPYKEEILEGLLGSSILGFHTQFHCNNFIETVDRFIESRIDREHQSVSVRGGETLIRPYPISIEWPPAALKNQKPVAECRVAVRERLGLSGDIKLGVGIERFDYTKGILDRLRAVDAFLTADPEWIERFAFLQVAAPTRSKLASYRNLQDETVAVVDEINCRHGRPGYKPIHLVIKHHEPDEVYEAFRAADICVVSSLHDGMNLVAKEFVAARDDEAGVLILSAYAGASRELSEALIVNPFDVRGTSRAIEQGLRMSGEEQHERMQLMRDHVRTHNVYRWAGRMLLDAARLRKHQRVRSLIPEAALCPVQRA